MLKSGILLVPVGLFRLVRVRPRPFIKRCFSCSSSLELNPIADFSSLNPPLRQWKHYRNFHRMAVEATKAARTKSISRSQGIDDSQLLFYRQRLFDYVRSNPKYISANLLRDKTVSGLVPSEMLKRMKEFLEEIASLAFPEVDSKTLADFQKRKQVLENDLLECRIENSDTLQFLADFFHILSEVDLQTPRFHQIFLKKLPDFSSEISPTKAVQALLYCATYRKVSDQVVEKLREKIVRGMDQLNLSDFEVLAFAGHILKIDFRSEENFLRRSANLLLGETTANPALITILKFLRQNGFTDCDFFRKLAAKLKNKNDDFLVYNGVECCHILQSFSAAKFYDEELYEKLQLKFLEDLENQSSLYNFYSEEDLLVMHPSKRIRLKDVANYLNSLAYIGQKIDKVDLIFEDLQKRNLECRVRPYFFVQALHALSMQGHYNSELLATVFSTKIVEKIGFDTWKDAKRLLYLLFKNCQFEFAKIFQSINVNERKLSNGLPKDFYMFGFEMKHRDMEVIENVQKILESYYGKSCVEWTRLIPHIEICGFSVKVIRGNLVKALKSPKQLSLESSLFAVEIMDSWTTCANCDKAMGRFEQKTRFLKAMGIPLIKVNKETSRDPSKLMEAIKTTMGTTLSLL